MRPSSTRSGGGLGGGGGSSRLRLASSSSLLGLWALRLLYCCARGTAASSPQAHRSYGSWGRAMGAPPVPARGMLAPAAFLLPPLSPVPSFLMPRTRIRPAAAAASFRLQQQQPARSFMMTAGAAAGSHEGAGAGAGTSSSDDHEVVLDMSEEELEREMALMDDMFKESPRVRRRKLREQNRKVREKEAKKAMTAAGKGGGKQTAAGGGGGGGGGSLPKAGPPSATNEAEALAQAKVYRKVEAPKRLVELAGLALDQGFLTAQLLKVVVRAEMEMRRYDLAGEVLDRALAAWRQRVDSATAADDLSDLVACYTEAVKWLCRLGGGSASAEASAQPAAEGKAEQAGAAGEAEAHADAAGKNRVEVAREVIRFIGVDGARSQRAGGDGNDKGGRILPLGMTAEEAGAMLTTLGKAYLKGADTVSGIRVLREMVALGGFKPGMDFCNDLLRLQGKQGRVDGMFATLDLMRDAGLHPDTDSYQHLGNTLVRSVDFVTGAVSMETLPPRPLPEVCFIGRSNVGKSSLLNMVCNRKDLAYVSKRPGKTQQFNYFLVNDKTKSAFYMVDVPGVGYAKVPLLEKSKWVRFFEAYLAGRESLRVVFHLIDSRHGPLKQDIMTMEAMASSLRAGVQYVVVLTKADKKDGKVSPTVMQDVQSALESQGLAGTTPVIVTSAVNRLGRDDMWRYLRLAVLKPTEKERQQQQQ